MDDPKAMLYLSVFEDYDLFSLLIDIMMYNDSQLKVQVHITVARGSAIPQRLCIWKELLAMPKPTK